MATKTADVVARADFRELFAEFKRTGVALRSIEQNLDDLAKGAAAVDKLEAAFARLERTAAKVPRAMQAAERAATQTAAQKASAPASEASRKSVALDDRAAAKVAATLDAGAEAAKRTADEMALQIKRLKIIGGEQDRIDELVQTELQLRAEVARAVGNVAAAKQIAERQELEALKVQVRLEREAAAEAEQQTRAQEALERKAATEAEQRAKQQAELERKAAAEAEQRARAQEALERKAAAEAEQRAREQEALERKAAAEAERRAREQEALERKAAEAARERVEFEAAAIRAKANEIRRVQSLQEQSDEARHADLRKLVELERQALLVEQQQATSKLELLRIDERLRDLARDRALLERQIAREQSGVDKLNAGVQALQSHWMAVVGAVTAVVGAITAANEAMEFGLAQRTIFANLPFQIDAARDSTLGLVKDMELSRLAIEAQRLKVVDSEEGFAELAKAATRLGLSVGLDAKTSIENLSAALGKGETELLDNLGITLRVAEAQRLYAQQLGISTKQLTEEQKAEAFRVIGLQKALEASEKVNLSLTESEQAWVSTKQEIDKLVREALPEATKRMEGLWQALGEGTEVAADVLPVLLQYIDLIFQGLRPLIWVVGTAAEHLGALFRVAEIGVDALGRLAGAAGDFFGGVQDWLADTWVGSAASWIRDTAAAAVELASSGLDRLRAAAEEHIPWAKELGLVYDDVKNAILGVNEAAGVMPVNPAKQVKGLLAEIAAHAKEAEAAEASKIDALEKQAKALDHQVKLAKAQDQPTEAVDRLLKQQYDTRLQLLELQGDEAAAEKLIHAEEIRRAELAGEWQAHETERHQAAEVRLEQMRAELAAFEEHAKQSKDAKAAEVELEARRAQLKDAERETDRSRVQALQEQVDLLGDQVELAEAKKRPTAEVEKLLRQQYEMRVLLLKAQGAEKELAEAVHDEEVRRAKAASALRGKGPTEAERVAAAGKIHIAQLEDELALMELRAEIGHRTEAEQEAFARRRLEIQMAELDAEKATLEATRAKNSVERATIEARLAGIERERKLALGEESMAAAKRQAERDKHVLEQRIAGYDREIEMQAAVGMSVTQLRETRRAATLELVELGGKQDEIVQAEHDAEIERIEERRAQLAADHQTLLQRRDEELEILAMSRANIDDHYARRFELEAQLARVEGDRAGEREALHKAEVARLRREAFVRQQVHGVVNGLMEGTAAVAEFAAEHAIKSDRKREAVFKKIQGAMAIARGATELVEGVAAVARYDFVAAAAHFVASGLGFAKGAVLLAGGLPGNDRGGSGGSGGSMRADVYTGAANDSGSANDSSYRSGGTWAEREKTTPMSGSGVTGEELDRASRGSSAAKPAATTQTTVVNFNAPVITNDSSKILGGINRGGQKGFGDD